MMHDAKLHRFDLILTKEVSRFSRNILDTISYTRDLKALGIGIFFLNDGIHSLEPDAELRLSIMGSIAQEESRKTSARVKWGQTRRMEQGVVFGRSLLGYTVKNGEMTIHPEGANIVRLIYQKYVQERKGTTVIARELSEAGYKTLTGSTHWRNTVILKILRNEKYCGDLKQKKTITPDYLTHQKKYNHGEEDFVFLKDHHKPIIDRRLWEEAQREIARRDLDRNHHTGHGHRYPLSGKINCGACGRSFVSRSRKQRDGSRYRVWRCSTSISEGNQRFDQTGNIIGCNVGYQLRNEVAVSMILQSVHRIKFDQNLLLCDLTRIIRKAIQHTSDQNQSNYDQMQKKLKQLEEKKMNALDAYLEKIISQEEWMQITEEYEQRIAELNQTITQATPSKKSPSETEICTKISEMILTKTLGDDFYGALLHQITVYPNRRAEVSLQYLPVKWTYQLTF